MKKLIKTVSVLAGFVVFMVVFGLGYLVFFLPNVGAAPDITIEITDERIERGHYLANYVSVCMDCHSQRDWSLFSGPPVPGSLGAGGEVFDESFGFPGRFISRNITPFAISDWTDGEIFRAITSGVDKYGKPLFPLMPYESYSKMDREDIYAIIAYIRSIDPVENELEVSKANFPVNLIMNTMPVKPQLTERPPVYDKVNYGAYLVNAAACADCHTKSRDGKILGEYLAGGFQFNLGNRSVVRATNITPDPETGIGNWSREYFVSVFRAFADTTYTPHSVNMDAREFQTVMPWMMYGGMTEEDLGAIYDYLMTVNPVQNRIDRFSLSD